ncbi:MAG: hypothetical protein HC822_16420 [Oscillochloris sp.]|nr:hypothetical protein [Oscillochloris sp.]
MAGNTWPGKAVMLAARLYLLTRSLLPLLERGDLLLDLGDLNCDVGRACAAEAGRL